VLVGDFFIDVARLDASNTAPMTLAKKC
jgi:hypothetical protein